MTSNPFCHAPDFLSHRAHPRRAAGELCMVVEVVGKEQEYFPQFASGDGWAMAGATALVHREGNNRAFDFSSHDNHHDERNEKCFTRKMPELFRREGASL